MGEATPFTLVGPTGRKSFTDEVLSTARTTCSETSNFPGTREIGDARGDVDRLAHEVGATFDHLAVVHAHPERQREPPRRSRMVDGTQDAGGGAETIRYVVEPEHQAVAEFLDDVATPGRQHLACDRRLLIERLDRGGVAPSIGELGESHEVGEEHRSGPCGSGGDGGVHRFPTSTRPLPDLATTTQSQSRFGDGFIRWHHRAGPHPGRGVRPRCDRTRSPRRRRMPRPVRPRCDRSCNDHAHDHSHPSARSGRFDW